MVEEKQVDDSEQLAKQLVQANSEEQLQSWLAELDGQLRFYAGKEAESALECAAFALAKQSAWSLRVKYAAQLEALKNEQAEKK